MSLLFFLLLLLAAGFHHLLYESNREKEDNEVIRRRLRIIDEKEFSRYRQEPLTIPPPPPRPNGTDRSGYATAEVKMSSTTAETRAELPPPASYFQHYRHGRGHHLGIGKGVQHFDAELDNDVSSFHHLEHTSAPLEQDFMPFKPRKFRPHFPLDHESGHRTRMKIHPQHKHHPIKASFDEFDGHTGEYVRSGHVTTTAAAAAAAATNGIPT